MLPDCRLTYAAAFSAVFFGVIFFVVVAFLVVGFFAVDGCVLVFATRPDLVFVNTVGLSWTAGA